MACVTLVSFSILVNDTPLKPFAAKKGLRLGDLISPYLFTIGMEYLSRLMRKMNGSPSFIFHPRCRKADITHLLSVDDLRMFCRVDTNSVTNMISTFDRLSQASRLEANTSKSNIYLSGVERQTKDRLIALLKWRREISLSIFRGPTPLQKAKFQRLQAAGRKDYRQSQVLVFKIVVLCK